jgi:hypothetical protein
MLRGLPADRLRPWFAASIPFGTAVFACHRTPMPDATATSFAVADATPAPDGALVDAGPDANNVGAVASMNPPKDGEATYALIPREGSRCEPLTDAERESWRKDAERYVRERLKKSATCEIPTSPKQLTERRSFLAPGSSATDAPCRLVPACRGMPFAILQYAKNSDAWSGTGAIVIRTGSPLSVAEQKGSDDWNPRWLAAEDLDGDGTVDLIAAAEGKGWTCGPVPLSKGLCPTPHRAGMVIWNAESERSLVRMLGIPRFWEDDTVVISCKGRMLLGTSSATEQPPFVTYTFSGKTPSRTHACDELLRE